MWHYEGGWRCRNDHVFAETAVEGVQHKVIRIDRPSARERLQDFFLGTATGGMLVALAVFAADKV